MQGKLVFNQSLSTFLSLKRFSKMAIPGGPTLACRKPGVPAWRDGRDARPSMIQLFAQREVCFCVARYSDRLGLVLGALMPRSYGVASVGNVLDLVFARLVRGFEVWGGRHDDITGHLRMDIAQQRHRARIVKLEAQFFALRPGAEVVGEFFIAADFLQAEDGIRDYKVTGVQTCALPICEVWKIPGACFSEKATARKRSPRVDCNSYHRSEERRVGKECRSRWSPYH